MASVLEAFASQTAFTKTNANLATSATAGWQSNAIDNHTNLYDDYLITISLAAVNTAPANSQAIYLYGFGSADNSVFTNTGAAAVGASEATLTFPNITTLPVVAPLLGVVPYPTQNVALVGGPFSLAACFNGIIPPYFAIGMVNYSGMTLSVTNIWYQGVYYTVA